MQNHVSRVYALSMLNGSLDSQLAVRVLQAQGVVVHGVFFESPFCDVALARRAAEQLDVSLHVVDYAQDLVSIIQQGAVDTTGTYSPCRRNHTRMVVRALEVLRAIDFKFIATGEVLDQREGVQSAEALASIEREADAAGCIVRPLSARLLPATQAEQNGWISREAMLDLSGRGHKRQRALAKEYGLDHFPNPTSGCRLVETTFNQRLDDLIANGGPEGVRSVALLRYGRHFRLSQSTKVIVGRNEKDNLYLEGNAELYDLLLKVERSPGPTALLPFSADEDEILRGAAICARYSDAPPSSKVAVRIRSSTGTRSVTVVPASPEQAEAVRIGG